MADLLERASAWLQQQRTKHLTRLVTYRRGESSAEIAATIGKTEFEVDDGFGVLQRIESRDYLVLTEHLVLDGQRTLPQRGDVIEEMADAETFLYEVTAPGKAPHWRYSDPFRQALRIHTKLVGSG